MDSDGNYETYDSGEEDLPYDEAEVDGEEYDGVDNVPLSESSDSESEVEDSGFSNNENGGSQELMLVDDGPSVLIQPNLLDEDDEGEDGMLDEIIPLYWDRAMELCNYVISVNILW